MRRNIIETVMGGVVLLVAAGFVILAFQRGTVIPPSGYEITAEFDNATGVAPGTDVLLSGVKVGTVTGQRLDPDTFFAVVTMNISDSVELPRDTSAEILVEGLLGNSFIALEPGGAEKTLQSGGQIDFTQGSINVIKLLTTLVWATGAEKKE